MKRSIVVVGAGIGGLSAAIELAAAGMDVSLFEASDEVGGKMRSYPVGPYRIDMGPSVLTLRHVFDTLFAHANSRLEDELRVTPLKNLARHFWTDGRILDLTADEQTNKENIRALFGAAGVQGFEAFASHAESLWDVACETFILQPKPSVSEAAWRFGRRVFTAAKEMDATRSLDQALSKFFAKTPQLRQLFGRYATYCGGSPFDAPASLALIAHVERQGVWHVAEGLSGLAQALGRVAQRLGVKINLNRPVRRAQVVRGKACGIELMDGTFVAADEVVLNTDIRASERGVLWPADDPKHKAHTTALADGMSHVAFGFVGKVSGHTLETHNVFFHSEGSYDEFHSIFSERTLPERPTVYVCAPDRLGKNSQAIEAGHERLFCLTNAPPLRRMLSAGEKQACQNRILKLLSRCGVEVTSAFEPHILTPWDFGRRFAGTDGAIYGLPPKGWQSLVARAGSRTSVAHLWQVGGSVHPGPGVPMAALSGRFAAQQILREGQKKRPDLLLAARQWGWWHKKSAQSTPS